MSTLASGDLEAVYDSMAQAIDRAGPEREALFLAKLALQLAHRLGDPVAVGEAIEVALRDLPG